MTDAIDPVASLLAVLDLRDAGARTTEDIFTGVSQPMPFGRVFGGQVLAQSIEAASRTLPPERTVHSMHGYFLRPGDPSDGVTFSVDRIHDGRSFSTRRTQAFQAGVPIFSMIASFQDDDPGLEHAEPMPEGIPQPEDLPPLDDASLHPLSRRAIADSPVEVVHVPSPVYTVVEGPHVPRQAVWMRTRRALPDDPAVHRAALAYLSDLTIQEPILRGHGVPWGTRGLRVASLDHAMWWHRAGRVDQWLLYVQESPNARGGRGLSTGRIYTREGTLLASVAQEVMVRVPGENGA
ncbi:MULTISPECIES: acyl-CoA thioesterase [unclassified Microbacterium]|uniref:acyl-CoA thioesterase n=1 Tax=unclassified Microbacterium TaxID=2609290 RepID=UPI001115949E|nr:MULTISPECIES: acyl-CoA thioesterase II [unclassified Microbacterium]MDI9890263.1 acyl-CoA thioesterase II [Microbacterium sp. IEGM 1404]MXS73536.1 acyl-CoA thioesterase II [Microbacterium sp. TL13]